jgi:NAD(P)H-hydrate repair Nnr-like enzyme with NAD(P)H-hydrate dehydratase domain
MAGATVVVVVGAATDVVVTGEPADAVTGCGVEVTGVVVGVLARGVDGVPMKAATVPPTLARTTAMAMAATTIRRLMDGMLRRPHQPSTNWSATLPVTRDP